MKIRVFFIYLIILAINFSVFSQNTEAAADDYEDEGYEAVEGLESWRHSIDLSGYPEGTYNIIIKGRDKAGNEHIEGPYNIYIDPESDKPVVNISNPEPQMRVNGNINIIGTCVDDDEVDSVEIKINDGSFKRATGAEFWSYYLETGELADGKYQITARGIDTNGIAGGEHSVEFILDRTSPRNEVTSHPNGALVNGKIILEGKSTDKNGIDRFEMSADGGQTYKAVSIKTKKNEPSGSFQIRIDTRDLEDGPHIYWFRSTDNTGSVGISSFLFFVDNKSPVLEIMYPSEDNQVNGTFSVVGRVSDEVGVDKLTYTLGREEAVEIPLSVGDPYWTQQFSLPGQTKADIRFNLTDKTGNSTMHRLQYELDTEGDKPVLQMISGALDRHFEAVSIAGFVRDDDRVEEVVYSIDGGEQISIPVHNSFNTRIDTPAPGEHKLRIYAADENGVKSNEEVLLFKTVLGKPEISFNSIIPSEGENIIEASQAVDITLGEFKSIEGRIRFMNKAGFATMSIDKGEELKLSLKAGSSSGEKSFSLPLKGLLPGYHSITVNAVDSEGLNAEHTYFLMLRGPDEQIMEKNMFSADERFTDSGKPVSPVVRMHQDDEIVFFIDGGTVKKAELSGEADFLKAVGNGSYAVIKSLSSGRAESLELTVQTSGGKSYLIGPFSAYVDDNAPVINVETELNDILINKDIEISGKISDDVELVKLEYSINQAAFTAIPFEEEQFSFILDTAGQSDGGISLTLGAEDGIGNRTEETFIFTKDTTPPELKQIAPLVQLSANGLITFAGRTFDDSGIQSVEFSKDGEVYQSLENPEYPVNRIMLSSTEQDSSGYVYRITDAAGNTGTFVPGIKIDTEGDTPAVRIQIPEEGVLIQEDFTISGMAFDDDQVDSILYRLDGDEFKAVGAGNNFEVPVLISDIADNAHTIEMKAVDVNGVESEISVLNINVSKSEPQSKLARPDIESTVNGIVEIGGISSDPNGISEVFLSYDNGNTFNRTELILSESVKTEIEWKYILDTELLEDGSHSLLVRAVDSFGVDSIYTTLINIDNTPPVIELTHPSDGIRISESANLKGRITDNIEIGEVYLEMQHLSVQDEVVKVELPLDEMLLRQLDFSGYPAGWLNLQLTAVDKTGNASSISRNIEIIEKTSDDKITFITPSKGEQFTGNVTVQGRIENMGNIDRIVLKLNDEDVSEPEVTEFGYFHAVIEGQGISEGINNISLEVFPENAEPVTADPISIFYNQLGPWIKIDTFKAGDFASNRPWLTGTAGYNYLTPQLDEKELKAFIRTREISEIEISLDNGKTFKKASGSPEWKYRLQTQELPNGELWILARARFRDGTSAVTKTMLIVDETPPEVDLVFPGEGMRFNDSLILAGTANDEFGIGDVSASLREGNKAQYQVPSFIQGLYIDAHFLGSTYAELGVGLTFFDDTVKLQLQAGLAPPGRFTGAVFGLKLLANLAVLPWDYFFGYDLRFFSSSFAVGTTFNYFTMPDDDNGLFGENGLVLGALLGQLELVKFDVQDWNMFSSYSMYSEIQFWFISSDVEAGIEPRLSFGIRTDVF